MKTLEALRKLGWKGNYLAWAHLQAEEDLERLKDDDFYVFGTNALFADNRPCTKRVKEASAESKDYLPLSEAY